MGRGGGGGGRGGNGPAGRAREATAAYSDLKRVITEINTLSAQAARLNTQENSRELSAIGQRVAYLREIRNSIEETIRLNQRQTQQINELTEKGRARAAQVSARVQDKRAEEALEERANARAARQLEVYRNIRDAQNEIFKLRKSMVNLDPGTDRTTIKETNTQINALQTYINEQRKSIKLSQEYRDALREEKQEHQNVLALANARASDASRTERHTQAYREYLDALKQVSSIEKELATLDQSTHPEEAAQLQAELTAAKEKSQEKRRHVQLTEEEKAAVQALNAESQNTVNQINARKADAEATKQQTDNFKELYAIQQQINALESQGAKLDPYKNAGAIATLDAQAEALRQEYNSRMQVAELTDEQRKSLDQLNESHQKELELTSAKREDNDRVSEHTQAYNEYVDALKQVASIQRELANLDADTHPAEAAQLQEELTRAERRVEVQRERIQLTQEEQNAVDALNQSNQDAAAQAEARRADAEAIRQQTESFQELYSIQQQINALETQATKLDAEDDVITIHALNEQADALRRQYEERARNITLTDEQARSLEQLNQKHHQEIELLQAKNADEAANRNRIEAQKQLNELYQQRLEYFKKMESANVDAEDRSSSRGKRESAYESYTYYAERLRATEAEINRLVGEGADNTKLEADYARKSAEYVQDLKTKNSENNRILKTQTTLWDKIQNALVHMVAQAARNALSNMWRGAQQYATKYYDQLNEIRVVTQKSQEEANKMGERFRDIARELSVSSEDIAKAATVFYRQGLSDADVEDRLRWVTEYAKVTSTSFDEAAELLTATINGYSGWVDEQTGQVGLDIEHITDTFIAMGNAAATSGGEMATAMQKVASVASDAGVSFEQLSAWIATLSERTRLAPESIGTALNTILARMRQIKATGFNNEDETKLNDVTKALATQGIALMDAEGNWRSMGEVFDEIGDKWADMDDKTRSYLATVMAGTRGQNFFIGLMEDLSSADSRAKELLEVAQNSMNTTADSYKIWQESITAAQGNLTASLENMYSKMHLDDLTKGFYNLAASVVNFLTPAISAFGTLTQETGALNIIIPTTVALIGSLVTKVLLMQAASRTAMIAVAAAVAAISLVGVAVYRATQNTTQLGNDTETAFKRVETAVDNARKRMEEADRVERQYLDKNTQIETLRQQYVDLSTQVNLSEEDQKKLNEVIEKLIELCPGVELALNGASDRYAYQRGVVEELNKSIEENIRLAKLQKQEAAMQNLQELEQNRWALAAGDMTQQVGEQFFNSPQIQNFLKWSGIQTTGTGRFLSADNQILSNRDVAQQYYNHAMGIYDSGNQHRAQSNVRLAKFLRDQFDDSFIVDENHVNENDIIGEVETLLGNYQSKEKVDLERLKWEKTVRDNLMVFSDLRDDLPSTMLKSANDEIEAVIKAVTEGSKSADLGAEQIKYISGKYNDPFSLIAEGDDDRARSYRDLEQRRKDINSSASNGDMQTALQLAKEYNELVDQWNSDFGQDMVFDFGFPVMLDKVDESLYETKKQADETAESLGRLLTMFGNGEMNRYEFGSAMNRYTTDFGEQNGIGIVRGNVDLTKRPQVTLDDGSIATIWSQQQSVELANGKMVTLSVTPILPDGTVLDDETLADYISDIAYKSNSLQELIDNQSADGKYGNLVLYGYEGDYNANTEELDNALHEMQAAYYETAVTAANSATEAALQAKRELAEAAKEGFRSYLDDAIEAIQTSDEDPAVAFQNWKKDVPELIQQGIADTYSDQWSKLTSGELVDSSQYIDTLNQMVDKTDAAATAAQTYYENMGTAVEYTGNAAEDAERLKELLEQSGLSGFMDYLTQLSEIDPELFELASSMFDGVDLSDQESAYQDLLDRLSELASGDIPKLIGQFQTLSSASKSTASNMIAAIDSFQEKLKTTEGLAELKAAWDEIDDKTKESLAKSSDEVDQFIVQLGKALDDGEDEFDGFVEKLNSLKLDKLASNNNIYGEYAEAFKAAGEDAEGFYKAFSGAEDRVIALNRAYEALNTIMNSSTATAEELTQAYNDVSSATGLSADTIKNHTDIAMAALQGQTEKTRASIQNLAQALYNVAGTRFDPSALNNGFIKLGAGANKAEQDVASLINSLLKLAGMSVSVDTSGVVQVTGGGGGSATSRLTGLAAKAASATSSKKNNNETATTTGKRGGGGGGGGTKKTAEEIAAEEAKKAEEAASKRQKLFLDSIDNEIDAIKDLLDRLGIIEESWADEGYLTGVINTLNEENKWLAKQSEVYQSNMDQLRSKIDETKAELASTDANSEVYDSVASRLTELEKKYADYNKAILQNTAQIKANEKAIKEYRKQIWQMESDLRDTINAAIEDRKAREKEAFEASREVEEKILEVVMKRYEKERDEILETTNTRIKALNKESSELTNQLNKRKQLAEQEDKAMRLSNLQAQYARISADPTRAKDAQKIAKEIAELQEEIAWDAAEQEVEAQQEAITEKVESLEDYASYIESYYDELLKDPRNFEAEVNNIMKMSMTEILEWLKANDEEYIKATANMQKEYSDSWTETLEKMFGIIKTNWDEVEEIISKGGDYIIQFLQENSQEFLEANSYAQKLMTQGWQDAIENLRRAYIDMFPTEQLMEFTNTALQALSQVQSAAASASAAAASATGGSGGGGGRGGSGGNGQPTTSQVPIRSGTINHLGQGSDLFMLADSNGQFYVVDDKYWYYGPASQTECVNWRNRNLPGGGVVSADYVRANNIPKKPQDRVVRSNNTSNRNTTSVSEYSGNNGMLSALRQAVERASAVSSIGSAASLATRATERAGQHQTYRAYASGGLIDRTGYAWLDGTKTNPESINDAELTRLLINADRSNSLKALNDMLDTIGMMHFQLPSFGGLAGTNTTANTINVGDIIVQVDTLNDDADFEEVATRVKDSIVADMSKGMSVGGIRFN